GILFDTFVILEKDDKILILDQHAAHERILYDKFLTINSPMQELLVPFVFNVADYEREFIEDNIPQIIASGFEIEAFGDNSYKINAVSVLFSNIALDKFVKGLLGSINEFKFDSDKLKRERIARLACHNAVRAGDKLNENQIRYILEQLQTNGNFNCPHGRPIVVVKSKTEIEKWFKRIV
ncbi:MAG: DNA mismatch repair protein MutL, partial [Clostridia bacterium]